MTLGQPHRPPRWEPTSVFVYTGAGARPSPLVAGDNLDAGRPDRVSLVFDRSIYRGRKNKTPGTFRTRVVTDGVTPSLHLDYKHTTIKQHHKQGRALRTETTINRPADFEIGKRLTNLPAPREIGTSARFVVTHGADGKDPDRRGRPVMCGARSRPPSPGATYPAGDRLRCGRAAERRSPG